MTASARAFLLSAVLLTGPAGLDGSLSGGPIGLSVQTPSDPGPRDAGVPYVVPRLDRPIRIDGTVSDPAWDAIDPLPVVVQHPEFGMPPTERTEMRLAHDGEHLYASCRCYVEDPATLRASSFFRDEWLNDDTFSLFLDTLRDHETGVHLYTNPLGTKFDALVYNDAEPTPDGLPRTPEWDTFWDVEATITEEGWFAEMRVPLSSLQFRDVGGRAVMGVVMYRLINAKNERHIHPALPPRWFRSYYKPSVAREVVLEGVSAVRSLHLTPYVLAGRGDTFEPGADPGTGSGGTPTLTRRSRRPLEAGLDARTALTSRFMLDLTVNTDFAQVEADDQQINLDRFSLFVPEKRRFFLERGSLFEFPLDGFNRLFHSRRIGLSGDGELLRILGGARLVGQVGGWEVGALSTQVDAGSDDPGENLGVVRARRSVLNRNSLVGAMVTTRVTRDGDPNVTYGTDAVLNVTGSEFVSVRWAHSFERGAPSAPGRAGHLDAHWERRGREGLGYRARFTWSGGDFEPGLGFLERRDYRRFGDQVHFDWLPASGPVQRHRLALVGAAFVRGSDGITESSVIGPEWELEMRDASSASIGVRRFGEDVLADFSPAAGVEVPSGSYTFHGAEARYRTPGGRAVRVGMALRGGGFFDGRRVGASVAPSWNVSRHLEVSGDYGVNRISFPDRGQHLTTHLLRARVRAALNVHASGTAFVQYNSVWDLLSANVRLRYHVRDGSDLYLVYNHGFSTDRLGSRSPLSATDARTVVVKVTHTLSR